MHGRNWTGTSVANTGIKQIHEIGWINVTIRRTADQNRFVGIRAELDEEEQVFSIKGRVDPMGSGLNTKDWIGTVEDHILPMMRSNDYWYTQNPSDDSIDVYRVTAIKGNEILLERQ